MQGLKQLAETYLGVAPTLPGEGTAWNFTNHFPWLDQFPPWGLVLAAAMLCGYVVWIYLRDAKSVPIPARVGLIVLRLMVIGLALLFLSGVTLSIDRTGLPVVVVLVDHSASMSLVDQYSDEKTRVAARKLLAGRDHKGDSAAVMTRFNLAKALLTHSGGRFLKRLLEKHKLRIYRFSDTATLLGRSEYLRGNEIDQLLPLLANLKADGDRTRPGPAVRKVLDDLRGTPPTAVIILTDGIASITDADKLSGIAQMASGRLIPIYPIGIGSEEPARDVQLYDLLVNEVAFVDDPILFSAKLKSYGYQGRPITLILRAGKSSTILARRTVIAGRDGEPVKLEIPYAPPRAGEFDYTLEAVLRPRETDASNNAETRHVSVRQEKIRVLFADAEPRWEFRAVKDLLARDTTIILHTVLQDADIAYAGTDETARPLGGRFPISRDGLFKYDVVILGDVSPTFLSSGVLQNLQDFVRVKGGGLILIAGPHQNPLAYRGTPLEVALPIQLDGAKAPPEDRPITEGYRPVLTLPGRKGSAVFRFAESQAASDAIWRTLPELFWLFEAPRLKRGAVAWAVHPARGTGTDRLPVIAIQQFGAGKVLFHATDELWRWREPYYGRYWVQAIRYLSRAKLLGRDRSAELTTDRLVYQRGETIHLRVRFVDERLTPVGDDPVVVMVERRGNVGRPVRLSRQPESPSVFEGDLHRAEEGTYHAWIATPAFNESPPATDFRVEIPRQELKRRSLDRRDLVRTAKLTHGRYISIAQADDLPDVIPAGRPVPLQSRQPIPLWNRWELMFLFGLVLLSEWLLRKHYRLL